jgi:hypothetical protein
MLVVLTIWDAAAGVARIERTPSNDVRQIKASRIPLPDDSAGIWKEPPIFTAVNNPPSRENLADERLPVKTDRASVWRREASMRAAEPADHLLSEATNY